jgi:uncharacterized integral membrane protein
MGDRAPEPERNRSDETRRVILGALIVIAVLFAVLNLDEVKVDLIFTSRKLPLIFVIVASLAVGAGIDRLLAMRRRRR